MNRNFYIYKNRISSENIEDSYEGQGNPSDDYSRLSSENQKKVDEIWRKIGKLESAYELRKLSKALGSNRGGNLNVSKYDPSAALGSNSFLSVEKQRILRDKIAQAGGYKDHADAVEQIKAGNKALNSKVKKQDVYSIPDTFDEYDDFSRDYKDPRSDDLISYDSWVDSPEYEQQEKEDRLKYENDRKREERFRR